MNRIVFLLVSLAAFSVVNAQTKRRYNYVQAVNIIGDDFYTDDAENLYVVTTWYSNEKMQAGNISFDSEKQGLSAERKRYRYKILLTYEFDDVSEISYYRIVKAEILGEANKLPSLKKINFKAVRMVNQKRQFFCSNIICDDVVYLENVGLSSLVVDSQQQGHYSLKVFDLKCNIFYDESFNERLWISSATTHFALVRRQKSFLIIRSE